MAHSEHPSSRWQRWIDRYIDLSADRPATVLLLLLAVTALLALSLPRLSLHTRIESLLPDDTVSLHSNTEASGRYAGTTPFFLVVQSKDVAMNRQVSERVLSEVRKWPETRWAMRARDPQFFLDHTLLFVDEGPLGEFAEEVDAYVDHKKCAKMPGCILLDDEPPKPSFQKLEDQLKSQPEVRSLSALFGDDSLAKLAKKKRAGTELADPRRGELCSKDGTVCVVQVTLDRDPTDLEYARAMVARGEALLKRLTPENAPEDTLTEVTGAYRDLPLTRAKVMHDLTSTFGMGLVLMMAVVMAQFRRVRALALLFVPLALGSVWTLGIFAWISPELNLISAAGLVILAGLGLDFALHILTHFGDERASGLSDREAMRNTIRHLALPLFTAAVTTSCGFAALVVASFRGFAQLGQFATLGIFCTLASALLVFPPVTFALQKIHPSEGNFSRKWRMPSFFYRGYARGPAAFVSVLGVVAFVASIMLLPRISLRYDLAPLLDEGIAHQTHFRDALPGTSRGAVLILADDAASLEAAANGIRKRFPNGLTHPEAAAMPRGKELTGAPVITPGTFIPKDQAAKLEHIALLHSAAKTAMKYGDPDWKEQLQPWLPMLEVEAPFGKDELPDWVQNSLKERSGKFGTVGLTYQDYPGTHAGKMLELSHKLDVLRVDHPKVRFASSSAVLGEVMPHLRQDGWTITGLALCGVLIATSLIGRSKRRSFLILSAIFLAISMTAGLMVLFDWRIDFYNLLVFPVAFGMTVDGAVFVVWTVLAKEGRYDWSGLDVCARGVFGSTMTTLVAFASLATSESGGLRSLGLAGTTALTVALLANLIWLPALLSWLWHRQGDRRGHQPVEPEDDEIREVAV